MSLLKYGISRDASEVVELLLQSGATATLETRDNDGWRPLHIACVNKSLRCAPILGAFGADLNAKTNRGITGLHILAAHRDMERAALVVAAFLKAGARPDEETSAGKTPLCFALQRNNHDLVKILLRAGASAEIANIHDHPLRHLLDGQHRVLEFLLENGAEPSLERPDQDGWRPLHLACANRTHSCVLVLLAAGADANAKTNEGTSALFLASSCIDKKSAASAANDLLKYGAHPDEPTNEGNTPLLAAMLRDNRELVKVLLRAGAEPLWRLNPNGETALHVAAACGHERVVKYLL
ncbi:hypothetical protein AURANDRAFT_21763, partial [Aureococcus anophagefferens]